MTIKPFVFNQWHAWQGTAGIVLSDESVKKLHSFRTTDDVVNFLWVSGDKPAARAFNTHCKG